MESEILSKLAKKGMKLGSTFDGFVFRHPVFEFEIHGLQQLVL